MRVMVREGRIRRRSGAIAALLLLVVGAPQAAEAAKAGIGIAAHLQPGTVAVRSFAGVTGTVTGRPTGQTLVLQLRTPNGWRSLGRARIGAHGSYRFVLRTPARPVRWTLRVAAGAPGQPTAVSTPQSMNVVGSAFHVSAATAAVVPSGSPVTVRGALSPTTPGLVSLQRQTVGGWVGVATTHVTGAAFAVSAVLPAGRWRLRVVRNYSRATATGVSPVFAVTVYPQPQITLVGLPAGMVGLPYSALLEADGGIPPYTWTADGLPPGVLLAGAGLTGTPTSPGDAPVTLTVTDAQGHQASAAIPLQVALSPAAGNTVIGWGNDDHGQLGDGVVPGAQPVTAAGLSGVTAIAAGDGTGYALRYDQTVWAWGVNSAGQLGDLPSSPVATPAPVPALSGVAALAAGADFALALRIDGTVWAWGDNSHGQLGQPAGPAQPLPSMVPALHGVIAVAAGADFALALRADGTVWAWGDNAHGQLGQPAGADRATPEPVAGLSQVRSLAAGAATGYALRTDSTVWTWGDDDRGQLGDGAVADSAVPAPVSGLGPVTFIAAGAGDGYAVGADGTPWAWGENDADQLGMASATAGGLPVQVPGLTEVRAVAAGTTTAAVREDGSVWTWGNSRAAAPVPGVNHAVTVAVGSDASYALHGP